MTIGIEVVYALAGAQSIVSLQLEEGATVSEALAASRIFENCSGLDGATCKVGIWGRVVPRTQPLRNGDRVEIYRPLVADPKLVRREKARQGRR